MHRSAIQNRSQAFFRDLLGGSCCSFPLFCANELFVPELPIASPDTTPVFEIRDHELVSCRGQHPSLFQLSVMCASASDNLLRTALSCCWTKGANPWAIHSCWNLLRATAGAASCCGKPSEFSKDATEVIKSMFSELELSPRKVVDRRVLTSMQEAQNIREEVLIRESQTTTPWRNNRVS